LAAPLEDELLDDVELVLEVEVVLLVLEVELALLELVVEAELVLDVELRDPPLPPVDPELLLELLVDVVDDPPPEELDPLDELELPVELDELPHAGANAPSAQTAEKATIPFTRFAISDMLLFDASYSTMGGWLTLGRVRGSATQPPA
jgi:hypothetical protein